MLPGTPHIALQSGDIWGLKPEQVNLESFVFNCSIVIMLKLCSAQDLSGERCKSLNPQCLLKNTSFLSPPGHLLRCLHPVIGEA